jgi:hypothetical protein
MNGLFDELKKLRENFDGKFIITREVKGEIIDRSINIKRFELEALKLKKLFDDKILELPSAFGVDDKEISRRTQKILDTANKTFRSEGKDIHLLDVGEVSCLALGRLLEEKKIDFLLAVDERTTRMLIEKPENLERLLENKLHTKIYANKENFKFFRGFKLIRSVELAYVAYKKNLVDLKNGQVLDALLYALKFKGCSVSEDEIREIEKLDN